MTITEKDVFIFYDGEAAEKAVEKMRRAIGKKNETQAAIKFAHTMLELWSDRDTIENNRERRRYDLLFAFFKIHTVRNQILEASHFANELAKKVYKNYTDLGGDFFEEEAYRTGRTRQDVIDEHYGEKPGLMIETRDKNAEEDIARADDNGAE